MLWLSKLDGPLVLRVNLPIIHKTNPQKTILLQM